MAYHTLIPLIKKTGSSLSPEAFQNIVNVVFHDIESQDYDAMHAEMWESLQEQFHLLVNDVLNEKTIGDGLKMLDIGSGTGLSTELLLSTKLGAHITHVTLLDTSPKMLALAEGRVKGLGKNYTVQNSDISSLSGKYDMIIVCSVLHHIPDLEGFLENISQLQNPGGLFIHLQDPNGDYMNDPEYKNRVKAYAGLKPKKKRKHFIPKGLTKTINKLLGRKTYIDQINDLLLEKKAIKKRMTAEEIWSVTDIHVEDLPFSTGTGISLKFLKENLPDYRLVKPRSYGFFGFLKSKLIPSHQVLEEQYIQNGDLNGRNIAATWIKK